MKLEASSPSQSRTALRLVLPASVFVLVWIIHFLWLGIFPERSPGQDRWIDIESATTTLSWWQSYLETQSYFLGFSYALSVAFTVFAIRKYREQRFCGTKKVVIGGISFSGVIAIAGCFLIGCCGSPMLAVYLGIFGTKFLPFAKSIVAGLTTLFVAGAWWWMNRSQALAKATADSGSEKPAQAAVQGGCVCDDNTGCS